MSILERCESDNWETRSDHSENAEAGSMHYEHELGLLIAFKIDERLSKRKEVIQHLKR